MLNTKLAFILLYVQQCTCFQFWNPKQINTIMRINDYLDSGTCYRSITSISYADCFEEFESNKFSFNAMVYSRRYLLCKLCFVTKTLTLRKTPGSVLVHYPITDVSEENVAIGKPSNQSSSLYSEEKGFASAHLAVDGVWKSNMNGDRTHFLCAHTNVLQASGEYWWMVNLEHIYPISNVSILNRSDCCWERLAHLSITAGETISKMQLCREYEGPGSKGEIVQITCQKSLLGQFLRISKPATEPLQLCEVAIYR